MRGDTIDVNIKWNKKHTEKIKIKDIILNINKKQIWKKQRPNCV